MKNLIYFIVYRFINGAGPIDITFQSGINYIILCCCVDGAGSMSLAAI